MADFSFQKTITGVGGATKTTVERCPNCKKPVSPADMTCKCGQFLLKITLQPKQRELLDIVLATGKDVPTKVGFGGSRGSAKSRAGRDIALLVALMHPNITVFIVCRNLAKAEENYTEKYRIERPALMKYYKSSPPPEFAFPPELGGSRIAFRYADNLNDIIGLGRGPECFLMIVEQAEAFTERELQELNTPNRWPEAEPGAVKTIYLFNPGGPGTDYLRRVFYSREYKGTERPGDYKFLQAYGWLNWSWFANEGIEVDGKPLTFDSFYQLDGDLPECKDGKYDDAWLASIPDNHRLKIFVTRTSEGRKMWGKPDAIRIGDLFGDFSKFEGQYFSGVWQPDKIVIRDSLCEDIIKPWFQCWLASDWGFAHDAATAWAATGKISPKEFKAYFGKEIAQPIDVVVVRRELVVSQTGEGDMADMIAKMTPENERKMMREYFLSPDAWQKRGSANTIADQIENVMKMRGMPRPEKAADDRAGGWRLLWNCMKQTCSVLSDTPCLYPGGFPMLLISDECTGVAGAIPVLIRDPKNREDILKIDNVWDDIGDCFAGGTLVKTSGGEVAIQNLKSGDMVWTRVGLRRVSHVWMKRRGANVITASFSDGSSFVCTPDHKVLANGEWASVDSLRYGDRMESWQNHSTYATGNAVLFCGLKDAGKADVWDIEVDGEHEFYANGILAHNCLRYLLYSKLSPTDNVPRSVRAREVLDSAGEHPNAKAMAMRIFDEKEKQRHAAVSRPRWRPS